MAKSKASKAHGAPPTKKVAARQTATPTTDVLSPSLLKQACKFLNTTAGLDLTLRLFQGFVIIAAKAQDEVISTQSFIAASQLDLGRRYLRFFVLLDCVHNVFETAGKDYASLAYKTLDLVEWSCLLMYFILENLTMLHDMKIHVLPWYHPVLVEANKFWFYAILASILRTLVQKLGLFSGSKSSKSSKKAASQSVTAPPWRKLVIDVLDLTLPASFIGWVAVDDVTIGCIMTVSTLLVWRDVWARAQ